MFDQPGKWRDTDALQVGTTAALCVMLALNPVTSHTLQDTKNPQQKKERGTGDLPHQGKEAGQTRLNSAEHKDTTYVSLVLLTPLLPEFLAYRFP